MRHSNKGRTLALVTAFSVMFSSIMPSGSRIAKAAEETAKADTKAAASEFVTTNGTKFSYQGGDFYYCGTNNYYINFKSKKDVEKVFEGAEEMGITVLRTWGHLDAGTIQKGQTNNGKQVFTDSADGSGEKDGVYYQYWDADLGKPVVNETETGIQHLDYVIAQAKKHNVKLIITFTNNWQDFGGQKQYVKWAGLSDKDEFYTNETVKGWYKDYVSTLLNHENVYTGEKYKDDPTIFAWELCNEPRCDTDSYCKDNVLYNWVEEMSAYVKSIDANHMVTIGDEGFFNYEYNSSDVPEGADANGYIWHGSNGVDYEKLITIPDIDFGTPHLYIKDWNMGGNGGDVGAKSDVDAWLRHHATVTHKADKPIILEEFGFNKEKEGTYFDSIEEFYTWMYEETDSYDYGGTNFWMLADLVEADGQETNVPYKNYDGFNIYSCSLEDLAAAGVTNAEKIAMVEERLPANQIIIDQCNKMAAKVDNNAITPSKIEVDLADAADAQVNVKLQTGASLDQLSVDGTALAAADYTLDGDTVTLKKSFLAGLEEGYHYIQFAFSKGKNLELEVNVKDSRVNSPVVNVGTIAFDKNPNAAKNILIPVVIGDGGKLKGVKLRGEGSQRTELTEGTDYTYTEEAGKGTVKLLATYLRTLTGEKASFELDYTKGTDPVVTIQLKDTTGLDIIDDFEGYADDDALNQSWQKDNYGSHAVGAIDATVTDSKAMKYSYELGNYCGLVKNIESVDVSSFEGLEFWFKPDDCGQTLVMQLKDAANNTWEKNITITGTEGQIVKVPFSEFQGKAGNFTEGASIGDSEMKSCAIYVNKVDNFNGQGYLYFDDIKFYSSGSDIEIEEETTTAGMTETQPATTEAETETQPATTEAETPTQPATTEAETETQPATTEAETETQPATTEAETETQPATTEAETETQPATTEAETPTQPATTEAQTETQPVTEQPTSEAENQEIPTAEDVIILDSFDTRSENVEGVNGWTGVRGFSYANGGDDNNASVSVDYSAKKKALQVSLDYSANAAQSWSEARIAKNYGADIEVSKKYLGYSMTYPAALDGAYKTKITAVNAEGTSESETFSLEGTIYEKCKIYNKETGLYTVLAYVPVEEAFTFNKLYISMVGSNTDFAGNVYINDVRMFDEMPVYVPPTEGLIYLLDDFSKCDPNKVQQGYVNNWKPLQGWQYSAGKATSNGQESTVIKYDKERQALEVQLDYSKDSDKSWSEAKINTWMDQGKELDISNTNQLRFDVTYPKEFDGFGVKIFANNYTVNNGEALIEAEASIKDKDKVDNGDGTITATVKVGYMKGITTPLNSICIGFVGKYSDFVGSIYVDNAEIWAVNVGVELPETSGEITKVDLSKMPESVKMADGQATKEAAAAYAYLQGVVNDGKVLFGHQNDNSRTVAGGLSDTKDITGSYSGVVAYDSLAITGSELGVTMAEGLAKTVASSKEAAAAGAIISLSTHLPNFATMKKEGSSDFSKYGFESSKDLTGDCAANILPGKPCNDLYNQYLDIIADYAKAMEGTPIIFRPLHENNGGWFWWGSSCTAETYKALYRYTVEYLQGKGVHNFIYEYSPNGPIMTEEQFLARYPGDEYVDVLAFDYYDDYNEGATTLNQSFFTNLDTSCKVIKKLADERGKVAVIAEAGVRVTKASGDSNGLLEEDNPIKDLDWYNKVNDVAAENGMAYFLLWANFSNQNFYVPYLVDKGKCQELGPDFVKFYDSDTSVFADGTNYNEALAKEVAVSSYSNVTGYMVDPVNFQEVLEPTTFIASAKNVEKLEYVIYRNSDDTDPVRVEAVKNTNGMYEAAITAEVLEQIGKVEIASVALVGDDTQIALAKYVSFGTKKSVAPAGTIDNFDYYYGDEEYLDSKYCGSNSAGGCSSTLSLSKKGAKDGIYAGKFTYSLVHSGSESWTGVGRALEVTDYSKDSEGNTTNAISMWVVPDGAGQKFVFQVVSNGFEFEAFLTDFMKGTTPQYVTIPFSALKPKVTGKVFDPSNITQMYFYCNSIYGSDPYTVDSDIYLDKIKAIKADETKIADVPLGGYVLSDTQLDGETDENRPVVPITGLALDKGTLSMFTGDSATLRAVVTPEDATDTDLVWSSSDETVATVNARGVVTGVGEGTATITVATADGALEATAVVTVVKAIEPPTTEATTAIETTVPDVTTTQSDTTGVVETSVADVTTTQSDTTGATEPTVPDVTTTQPDTTGATEPTLPDVTTTQPGTTGATEPTVPDVTTTQPGTTGATEPTLPDVTTTQPGTTGSQGTTTQPVTTGSQETTTQSVTTGSQETTTQSVTTGNQETTTQSVTTGNQETTTQPVTTGSEETTQPVTTGSEETTQPVTTGSEETTQPVTTGSEETTQPVTTGSEETTQPVTTGSEETTQSVTTGSEETTQPVTTGSEETTTQMATTSSQETTTQPTTTGNQETTTTQPQQVVEQPTVPAPVVATGIKLNRTTANIVVGKTKSVRATVTPSNASNKSVTFVSSNKNVATVNASGVIKGVRPGVATVTARTANGKTATVKVKVRPAQVKSLKKSVKGNSVKLSWKKQKGVTGYIIYKNIGSSNKYKYYKTTKKNSVVIKNLKKNTSYRFKVRAYKNASGKLSGSCSAAVKVRTSR